MIGRESELVDLIAASRQTRLLTIIGAGGVGKTTLAVEAARQLTDDFIGGTWLFELATLTDGRRIATTMLGAMSRPAPVAEDPVAVLAAAVSSQKALLVIDNCEHVLDDVATIAASILRAAPEVTILATSREPLGIAGERVWTIPTMGLPADGTADSVAASASGAMFVERASAALGTFKIDEDNAPVVAELCRRLDGLPLAIELAAARLRSLSLAEIAERLEDRFKLLRGGLKDSVSHHQTLRDTVLWSYELLAANHQALYRRLCVFAGGFDLAAAEAVSRDDDVLGGIDHLVNQSLLIADRGESTRYRMLETIRQFGWDQLAEEDEEVDARRAHLAWMQALVKEGGRELEGRDQVAWLRRFRIEIDNIRTALGWARDNDPVAGSAIAASLSRFFWMHAAENDSTTMRDSTSFLLEGHDWGASMIEAAGEALPDTIRARLQMAIGGLLCNRIGYFDEGLERLHEAAGIFEREGDIRNLGWATFYTGLTGVGIVPLAETVAAFERSIDLHETAGDKFGVLIGTLLRGYWIALDDLEEGVRLLHDFHDGTHKIGVPALVAHGADAKASVDALANKVTADSHRHVAEALLMFRRLSNYACICHTLAGAAMVLGRQGDIEGAARAIGIADATRQRLSMVTPPYEERDQLVEMTVGSTYGDADWAAARAEGRTFEPDEGIDWIIERLGIDPVEFTAETGAGASS